MADENLRKFACFQLNCPFLLNELVLDILLKKPMQNTVATYSALTSTCLFNKQERSCFENFKSIVFDGSDINQRVMRELTAESI